jgi:hypothetical protein
MSESLWAVWETEHPENGVVGVQAASEADALRAYESAGYKDGTAALSASTLVVAAPGGAKAQNFEDPSTEELAKILKAGHGAIIRETRTWWSIAEHVLGLMRIARAQAFRHCAKDHNMLFSLWVAKGTEPKVEP